MALLPNSLERIFYDAFEAKRLVINEAGSSNMPGQENGPYDAYRHLLIAAELTRRYGEETARFLLGEHEFEGITDGQESAARKMDEKNNEEGIRIGKNARDWDDVVRESRNRINDATEGSGSPASNPESPIEWRPPSEWSGKLGSPAPRDPDTDQPKPPEEWNWPSNPELSEPAWPEGPFPPPKGLPFPWPGNHLDPEHPYPLDFVNRTKGVRDIYF